MNDLQKRDELVNNAVHNVRKLMEEWHNRLAPDNLRLAERYVEGALELNIHFRLAEDAADFCAVLRHASGPVRHACTDQHDCRNLDASKERVSIDIDRRAALAESHNEQQLVLVDIVELVEFPQRIAPTSVWLAGRERMPLLLLYRSG